MAQTARTRGSLWGSVFNTRMLICIFCGFSSGMPLYVLFQMLPAWLRTSGVDLSTIALFSIISFPYTWKFIWSPLMDRYTPPLLGRRRGWALVCQVALVAVLAGFSLLSPTENLTAIAALAGITALFSASQDIVLDAYRRELLPDVELGMGNSWFVNAYRLSSLVPGSLALILADRMPWSQVHLIVAAWMLVGVATTLLMPEPEVSAPGPHSFREAILDPFREFFTRSGVGAALLILAFMLFYKLGDSMATALATPFYLDMGFSMTEIGTIAKVATLWASVTGAMLGGVVMIKVGINRSLWLFGVVQLISILGFAALSADSNVQPIVDGRPYADAGQLPADFAPYIEVRAEEDEGLINLNTASEAELIAAEVSEAAAAAVVERRSGGLLNSMDVLSDLSLPAHTTLRIDVNHAAPGDLAQLPGLAPSRWLLFLVVSFEYLGVGLGTAAFVAFIARSTDKRYTATQFALLTSLTGIPRTFANATTGFIIEGVGYTPFFLLCTALAVPGMVLLLWVAPWGPDPEAADG